MFNKKLNKKGISYVVSTLVLTVVVIIGALGVGVIMNSVSNDAAKQVSSGNNQNGIELTIGGSTTVQPLTQCIGDAYMKDNKGVRITVQGGGSDYGITAAALDIFGLGASSKALTTQTTTYPNIQQHEIGGSAVVVITSTGCTITANATKAAVKGVYNGSNLSAGTSGFTTEAITNVYDRSDSSGTETTFAKWVGMADSVNNDQLKGSIATGASGNAGVLAAVQACGGSKCCVGFVNFGYADGVTTVKMLNITNVAPTTATINDGLKGLTSGYESGLITKLYYISNGNPNSVEQSFLDYVTLNGGNVDTQAGKCYTSIGYIPVTTYKKA